MTPYNGLFDIEIRKALSIFLNIGLNRRNFWINICFIFALFFTINFKEISHLFCINGRFICKI